MDENNGGKLFGFIPKGKEREVGFVAAVIGILGFYLYMKSNQAAPATTDTSQPDLTSSNLVPTSTNSDGTSTDSGGSSGDNSTSGINNTQTTANSNSGQTLAFDFSNPFATQSANESSNSSANSNTDNSSSVFSIFGISIGGLGLTSGDQSQNVSQSQSTSASSSSTTIGYTDQAEGSNLSQQTVDELLQVGQQINAAELQDIDYQTSQKPYHTLPAPQLTQPTLTPFGAAK